MQHLKAGRHVLPCCHAPSHEIQTNRLEICLISFHVEALDVIVASKCEPDDCLITVYESMPPLTKLSITHPYIRHMPNQNSLAALSLQFLKFLFEPLYEVARVCELTEHIEVKGNTKVWINGYYFRGSSSNFCTVFIGQIRRIVSIVFERFDGIRLNNKLFPFGAPIVEEIVLPWCRRFKLTQRKRIVVSHSWVHSSVWKTLVNWLAYSLESLEVAVSGHGINVVGHVVASP